MFKKKPPKPSFDKSTQIPILKCSICTGEQVACFKNIQTGKTEEIMLIRDASDLALFQEMYGIDSIKKEY